VGNTTTLSTVSLERTSLRSQERRWNRERIQTGKREVDIEITRIGQATRIRASGERNLASAVKRVGEELTPSGSVTLPRTLIQSCGSPFCPNS